MKIKIFSAILSACLCHFSLRAGTTIDAANHFAYGANAGWMDWRGDTNNGAVIGEYVCSGYIYSANVGWISLGSGSPANQIQYQNNSAADFGVNQDGLGNLRGCAYGANIGWIAFETNGAPKVNLATGQFTGYAYSANCGWISLSNTFAVVQTDLIQPAPLAPDGLPIAWLLQNFGTTNVNANADPDGDGASNQQEYLAGTDPNNAASVFEVIFFNRPHGTLTSDIAWNAVSTRYYALQSRPSLTASNWTDLVNLPIPGLASISFTDTDNTNEFYRVRAYRPLEP
jgi:hypothetical protein